MDQRQEPGQHKAYLQAADELRGLWAHRWVQVATAISIVPALSALLYALTVAKLMEGSSEGAFFVAFTLQALIAVAISATILHRTGSRLPAAIGLALAGWILTALMIVLIYAALFKATCGDCLE